MLFRFVVIIKRCELKTSVQNLAFISKKNLRASVAKWYFFIWFGMLLLAGIFSSASANSSGVFYEQGLSPVLSNIHSYLLTDYSEFYIRLPSNPGFLPIERPPSFYDFAEGGQYNSYGLSNIVTLKIFSDYLIPENITQAQQHKLLTEFGQISDQISDREIEKSEGNTPKNGKKQGEVYLTISPHQIKVILIATGHSTSVHVEMWLHNIIDSLARIIKSLLMLNEIFEIQEEAPAIRLS